jgi:polyhydroxyalkanoate synthesis regulator phasin
MALDKNLLSDEEVVIGKTSLLSDDEVDLSVEKKNEPISGKSGVLQPDLKPQSVPSTVSGTRDKFIIEPTEKNIQELAEKRISDLQGQSSMADARKYAIDEINKTNSRITGKLTLGDESRQMGIAKGDVFGEIKVNAENAQKALEDINQSRYVRTKKLQEQTVAKQDQVFQEGKKIENLSSQIDFATNLPQYKELTAIDGQLAAMGEPKTKEQIDAYNALVAKRDALLDTDVSQTDEYNATVTIPTFNMPSDDMSEEVNRQNQIKDIVNKGKKSFEAKAAYEGKVKLRDVLGVADIKSKELSTSINKYKENAAQIDLNIKEMYNLNKDKLEKVGFTKGFFDGINQTTISNTLADLYLSGDDDQLGKSLENLYMEQATMPTETTVGGDIGTMIGGQVKPMAVSVTASALSPAVGVGAGALYYGRMGIGSGILDVYTTARSQGKTQAEALALAKKQAVVGGVGGVVEGLAGLVTAGGKPVASVVSKSFKEAVKSGLKEAQIDVVTAGLVAAGQNANIQRLGLDRKLHEGVIENMAGEAFFGLGVKVAVTGGQKVKGYGTIVNTMAKAPFQDIQAIVDDAVKQGVANEANANQFIQDVQKSAKAQQKLQGVEIPEQSVDDVIDLQKQLDVLEEQKKTASPAALPAIEGKIEQLSSEIQIKAAIPLTAKEKAELNKLQTAKDSNTDYDKERLKFLEDRQKEATKIIEQQTKAEQEKEAQKIVEAQQPNAETVEVELEPTVSESKVNEGSSVFSLGGNKIFFHASSQKRSGRLKNSNAPQFGTGVYFSTNKDLVTNEFGENITEAELTINKPVYTNTKEWNEIEKEAIRLADEEYGKKKGLKLGEDEAYFRYDPDNISEIAEIPSYHISDAAKKLGYDAIIDKNSSQYENEIIVLDESKILYPEDKQQPVAEAGQGGATEPTQEVKAGSVVGGEVDLTTVEYKQRYPKTHEVVFVDPSKVLDRLTKDDPDYDVQNKKNQIGSRVQKAKDFILNYAKDKRWINPKTGVRSETTKAEFEPSIAQINNGKISFEDGRHRILAAKELGIGKVAIEVPKGQANQFKKDFEAVEQSLKKTPKAEAGQEGTTEQAPVVIESTEKVIKEAPKAEQVDEVKPIKILEASRKYVPLDTFDAVMKYFAVGGRINTEDLKSETGFGSQKGGGRITSKGNVISETRGKEDFKKRSWVHSSKAPRMDDLVMNIAEEMTAMNPDMEYDQQQIRSEIIEVLSRYDSKLDLQSELAKKYDDASFMENYGMTRSQYEAYVEEGKYKAEQEKKWYKENGLNWEEQSEMDEYSNQLEESGITEEDVIREAKEYDEYLNTLSNEEKQKELDYANAKTNQRGESEKDVENQKDARNKNEERLAEAKRNFLDAENEYNKVTKALEADLANKQSSVFEGKEQKLFDDSADLAKQAKDAKRKFDEAKEAYDKAQGLVDDKLKGQVEIDLKPTKLEAAKAKLAEIKKKRDELAKKKGNLGAVVDPFEDAKNQAKADRELFDAYVEVAKEYIAEVGGDIQAWAEEIGEEINDNIKLAWDEASGKKAKVEEKSIFETYDETKGASKKDKLLSEYAKENPEKAQRVREIIDNFEDMKTMLQTKIDNGEIKNLKIEC